MTAAPINTDDVEDLAGMEMFDQMTCSSLATCSRYSFVENRRMRLRSAIRLGKKKIHVELRWIFNESHNG